MNEERLLHKNLPVSPLNLTHQQMCIQYFETCQSITKSLHLKKKKSGVTFPELLIIHKPEKSIESVISSPFEN